ncbi:MAG: WG repeat-containing protein [Candidatus Sifarchaeia archaeon]|jgi:hypothetical protein
MFVNRVAGKLRIARISLTVIAVSLFLYCVWLLLAKTPTVQYKTGFIDRTGKFVIKPVFDKAHPFSEGLAAIKVDHHPKIGWRRIGYINKEGIVVIRPQFSSRRMFQFEDTARFIVGESVFDFLSGRLPVFDANGKHGYIDKTGQFVIEPKFDYARPFSEGLAVVSVNNENGVIDVNGHYILEPLEAYIGSFSEGLAEIMIKDKSGFINEDGRIVIEPQYEEASGFAEGMACVKIEDKWGFINKKGQIVIEPKYDNWVGGFKEGVALVQVNNEWFVIDKKGDVLSKPIVYKPWSSFHEGLALVMDWKSKKCGYINKKGDVVIDIMYSSAGVFSEGLAYARIDKDYGYINKEGRFAIRPQFVDAGNFSEGLAHATTKVRVRKKDLRIYDHLK